MSARPGCTPAQLVEKIALELVFAEAGKEGGLLPVNSLLSEMEEQSLAASLPAVVMTSLALARGAVEAALEAGVFTPRSLEQLSAWTAWLPAALAECNRGQPPPAMPPCLGEREAGAEGGEAGRSQFAKRLCAWT